MDPIVSAIQELQALQKSFIEDFKVYRTSSAAEIKALGERQKTIEDALRERLIKGGRDQEQLPEKKWSWARVCAAAARRDWALAPFEKGEIDAFMETKAAQLLAGVFGQGGALVPPQHMTELIELLRAELIIQRLGVRMMDGLIGSPVVIPKQTGGATAAWLGENAQLPQGSITTGQLQLQPHKLGVFLPISNDLILLSNPGVEGIVREDLARAMAEKFEDSFFNGTGTLAEPLGLKNWSPAITSIAGTWTSADTASAANMLTDLNILKDFLKQLRLDKAFRGSLAWAMNPVSWAAIGKLVDANNRPFLQVDPSDDTRQRLLGYPVYVSTLVSPTGTDAIYFGNWQDTIVGTWAAMTLDATSQGDTAFRSDETWIRAILRADVAVRLEKSIATKTDID